MTEKDIPTSQSDIMVRPLLDDDLAEAKRIFHLAFGTYLGLADPMEFWPDRDYVRTRHATDPSAALAAEVDGEVVGSNFVANWGSVGYFGPLTIRPDYWDRGVAKRLLERTMEIFDRWETEHAGLFTFAQSAKHVGLYQKFGFWPRFLTAVMSVETRPAVKTDPYILYSQLNETDRVRCLRACRDLTKTIYGGLDVESEIRAITAQKLGDIVLIWDNSKLLGLALCHCGQNTEAGKDSCYIKFAGVRPEADAARWFDRLLNSCEAFAASRGLGRIEAGVNLARHEAYRQMLGRGFRTQLQGVAMHKPNEPGYSRPGMYVIDDWR